MHAARRFPLQLELLAPEDITSQIMAPSEYHPPANVGYLYDQGKDITEVCRAVFWVGMGWEEEHEEKHATLMVWGVCSVH